MVDFGLGSSSSSKGSRSGFGEIEVQWGKSKLRVPLPPPNSPLSTLKDQLYTLTGVPPAHQKLISFGAVLKDDLAPLSSYDLVDSPPPDSSSGGSLWDSWSWLGGKERKLKKVIMLGSKTVSARVDDRLTERKDLLPVAQEEVVAKKEEEEPVVVARIQDISGKSLDEIEPQILELEAYLAQRDSPVAVVEGAEPAVPLEAPNPRTPIFLSELLLQNLLKLDSFNIPSGWVVARKERKDAVRKVQGALDRVDAAKDALKARL